MAGWDQRANVSLHRTTIMEPGDSFANRLNVSPWRSSLGGSGACGEWVLPENRNAEGEPIAD